MRIPSIKTTMAATIYVAVCAYGAAQAGETTSAQLAQSMHVAGHDLQLNGSGVSSRLLFKVYSIGLYLQDQRRTTEAVLASNGPRRLFIRLLRDVSADDFRSAVLAKLGEETDVHDAQVNAHMQQLAQAIAAQPQGLRRGDLLTLDWIPNTGTVVQLNQRTLTQPLQNVAFYNALLNIWLGDKPTDTQIKTALLGKAPA